MAAEGLAKDGNQGTRLLVIHFCLRHTTYIRCFGGLVSAVSRIAAKIKHTRILLAGPQRRCSAIF